MIGRKRGLLVVVMNVSIFHWYFARQKHEETRRVYILARASRVDGVRVEGLRCGEWWRRDGKSTAKVDEYNIY